MISTVYDRLIQIAQQRFPEIVVGGKIVYSTAGRARKLRIYPFEVKPDIGKLFLLFIPPSGALAAFCQERDVTIMSSKGAIGGAD
jgi:hypothetical protein